MSHPKYVSAPVPYVSPTLGIVSAGVTGAVITGAGSAACEIRKVKNGEIEKSEAVSTVAKNALGGGLAVATGAAVGKLLFRSNILGAAAMVATSVGVLYALNGLKDKKQAAPAEAEKTVKKERKS